MIKLSYKVKLKPINNYSSKRKRENQRERESLISITQFKEKELSLSDHSPHQNSKIKATFELAVNGFRKLFSVKPVCLAATENRISGK